MIKTLLRLPSGVLLSSGPEEENALQSIALTQTVNDGTELTLGSVCAAMLEATLFTPNGGLTVRAGDSLTLFRQAEGEEPRQIGVFICEKPTRTSANTLKITAYDHIGKLDKDLSGWLAELTSWPYSLKDFASLVCEACGVTLGPGELLNEDYFIPAFSAEGITGRQLMAWIGQIGGRFCKADAQGNVVFSWYTPALGIAIGPSQGDGVLGCFQGGLKYEDYTVAPIEKVQIKGSSQDVGTQWPTDGTGEENTYIISGNMLLPAENAEALQPVAENLYSLLREVSYTPCQISMPAGLQLQAGDAVYVTDRNGISFTAYIMTKKQAGQKDTLSCTGSYRRDSVTAVNSASYKALSGKVMELTVNVDGLRVENKDTQGTLASLALSLDGLSSQVTQQVDDLEQKLTAVEQTAQAVTVSVEKIQQEGTSQVKTATGYTFDENGLSIAKSGTQMENLLNENGMYVTRSGEVMLQADKDGVVATDVTIRNYLIVGEHCRFEDYANGTDTRRTACYWR